MGKTLDAEISRVFEIRPICFRGLLRRMVRFLPVRTYMNSQDTLAMSWVSCWLCSRVFEMASVTPQPQQAGGACGGDSQMLSVIVYAELESL